MYIYKRSWLLCKKCGNPIWYGNSYRFTICYKHLKKKQKEFISKEELEKYEYNQKIPIETRLEFVKSWDERFIKNG